MTALTSEQCAFKNRDRNKHTNFHYTLFTINSFKKVG